MSDTLQEREDEMTTIGFCAKCQGYTHVPWCSEYESPKTESQQLCEPRPSASPSVCFDCGQSPHATGCQQWDKPSITAHEPAARGGGDEVQRIRQRVKVGWCAINERSDDPYNLSTRLEDTEYLLDQHQSLVAELDALKGDSLALVAERGRLIVAAKAVVERLADLPRYLEKNDVPTLATMTAECLADLAVAIPAEQRSTSE